MAKMNLSVPDDLKAEMDKLHWVNWSKVFADASADVVLKARTLERNPGGLAAFRDEGMTPP